jgi:hypothetical protein
LGSEQRPPELRWSDLYEEQSAWLQYLVTDESARPDAAPGSVRELLESVLAQLPPNDRLIISLLDLEGKPVKEIAQFTGRAVPRINMKPLLITITLVTSLQFVDAQERLMREEALFHARAVSSPATQPHGTPIGVQPFGPMLINAPGAGICADQIMLQDSL